VQQATCCVQVLYRQQSSQPMFINHRQLSTLSSVAVMVRDLL